MAISDSRSGIFHLFFKHWPGQNGRFFFERILAAPDSYDPPPVWSLFWALVKAEHEFLYQFVPFWSNEERLTGHLVSQMVERLREFAPHWLALNLPGEDASSCRVWYADTAASRQEEITGADLGVVIHGKFSRRGEFFKVARFQAKKADTDGNARIRLDQLASLLSHDKLGYYLFYHPLGDTDSTPPPTVKPAESFKSELEEAVEKMSRPWPTKNDTLQVDAEDDYDFATFLTFALADPASEHGKSVSTPKDAVHALMSPGPNSPGGPDSPFERPTRVLIITLGVGVSLVDWPHFLNPNFHE